MARKDAIEMRGKVVELVPNNLFRIQLDNGQRVLAHSSGRMRMSLTKILPGDTVMVEMSPYDLTKGRITCRNK